MSESLRVPLTISSDASSSLGPLSVEIIPEEGDPTEFSLTSGYRNHAVYVPPGRYAVIARRPNGKRLRQSVTVNEGAPMTVQLADVVPMPPNEFLVPEAMRGEIAPALWADGRPGVIQGLSRGTIERTLKLRVWAHEGSLAPGAGPSMQPQHGSFFLKVPLHRGSMAVGLMDETGFGPIVIVPSFRNPVQITFLTGGLTDYLRADEGTLLGRRAPVALVTLAEPHLSDLLTALGALATEDAIAIWEQNIGSLDDLVGYWDVKFPPSAEALLGAHYLLRFLPDKLPLKCADALVSAVPDAADGPVIAAWLRLLSRSDDVRTLSPTEVDRDVQSLLIKALARPTTMFARTRSLLAEALHFFLHPLELLGRPLDGTSPTEFVSYGAFAGGLEAFWGTDPLHPGPKSRPSQFLFNDIMTVRLRGLTFFRTGASPGLASVRNIGRYDRISAAGFLDLTSLPSELFVSEASREMRDLMPFVADGPRGPQWVTKKGETFGLVGSIGPFANPDVPGLGSRVDRIAEVGLRAGRPDMRVKELDRDGVDAEVIYGSGILMACTKMKDREAANEMLRIYNNWLKEFCSHYPDRQIGLACLPYGDISGAVGEVYRVAKLGLRGLELSCSWDIEPMWHPVWEPLWQAVSDVQLPLHFNISSVDPEQRKQYIVDTLTRREVSLFQINLINVLAALMGGGVFERYPNIRVVFGESGIGWIPYALDRMDFEFEDRFRDLMKLKPSEYWHRQCKATFQYGRFDTNLIENVGVATMMWGSYYPHLDGLWPESSKYITEQFSNLSPEIVYKMTCENAGKLYGLIG